MKTNKKNNNTVKREYIKGHKTMLEHMWFDEKNIYFKIKNIF